MYIPDDVESQQLFHKLKTVCVPLMGNSKLSNQSIETVSGLLSQLLVILDETQTKNQFLKPSLVSYVFMPLSTLLQRNSALEIPDQILEKLLLNLSILCESWWWFCEERIWEQIFMLAGSVITGIEGKAKGKERDEETRTAAVKCLGALTRARVIEENVRWKPDAADCMQRLDTLQRHAQSPAFIPIVGQTLDSLLGSAQSHHGPLQDASLDVLRILIKYYLPEDFVPSVLPGVVSSATKVALGVTAGRTWERGAAASRALVVLEDVVIRSIGDDVCIQAGAIHRVSELEDLADLGDSLDDDPEKPKTASSKYATQRTPSWLRATASQLHMALISLTPLTRHPNGEVLRALCQLSSSLLEKTAATLAQSRLLLLSSLLSVTNSTYDAVAQDARNKLRRLLTHSSERVVLLRTLVQIARDNLSSLPRLILSHSDSKVEHAANLIIAICQIGDNKSNDSSARLIADSIGTLLGPTGGIEKWGWSLLSPLELEQPTITVAQTSAAQLLLEGGATNEAVSGFPSISMQHVESHAARRALEGMFHALGAVAEDRCLFSIEWFMALGRAGKDGRAVSALWCACRLLEGAAGVRLDKEIEASLGVRNRRIRAAARVIVKSIGELWDESQWDVPMEEEAAKPDVVEDENHLIEHVSGLTQIHPLVYGPSPKSSSSPKTQQLMHITTSLQVLAVCAGILQAKFTNLLLPTIYPILHSVVSPISFISSAGFAALTFVATSCSYATPANLLLSNFDYALDAVSRRLTRRWLDVDATRVLVLLVRLVGRDVVQKAEDVVEACFDRLDEFHGYVVIVNGLVEVLDEVVRAVKEEGEQQRSSETTSVTETRIDVNALVYWFEHRHDKPDEDTTDYGPAPHEAWGNTQEEEAQDEAINKPEEGSQPNPTPIQRLTAQIVSRSLYFLTHGSATIRAHILTLLASSVSILPETSLLPSIHGAWPFIRNRLSDPEPYVVGAAARLIEALSMHMGEFMYRRIWDDVWPQFRKILRTLDVVDAQSALARRTNAGVTIGTESAYTNSHRLYRALLRTMTAAARGTQAQDNLSWEVMLAFRRFLDSNAHHELQECARSLYVVLGQNNCDAVWLALQSTLGSTDRNMTFMEEKRWNIARNVDIIMQQLDG